MPPICRQVTKNSLFVLAGAALAVLGGGLALRVISRRHSLPCPWWLSGLLDNPYVRAMASPETLLDRAGITPGMLVLDVGCGPGRLTVPAARRVGRQGSVTAVDIQPEMIAQLKRRLTETDWDNVYPRTLDIAKQKLEPKRYDRALLCAVLGEIPDRISALRNIHESLKPGGLLSVTEILPDPHYQTRRALRRAGEFAGFHYLGCTDSRIAYTMNFGK